MAAISWGTESPVSANQPAVFLTLATVNDVPATYYQLLIASVPYILQTDSFIATNGHTTVTYNE